MKIFVASILKWNGTTGVQTHVRETFQFLKTVNTEPRFICPHDGSKLQRLILGIFLLMRKALRKSLPAREVELYRYGHGLILKWRLKKVLASGEASVVYAQCPISAQAAFSARVGRHQKVILVVHFNVSQADEFAAQGRISNGERTFNAIRASELDLLPRLDGLIFVSKFMHHEIAKRIPNISFVPHRVFPNSLADPLDKHIEDIRGGDLVCIGTLEPRKNQRYALEIIAAAKKLGREISLTLIGDGPDRAGLISFARELKVENSIRFLGYVSEAAHHFPAHKACLHVAKVESFGIVLIEAMSRGVPVFAPAVGGIPEVFADGVEGRLIPLHSSESAAKIILQWLDSPDVMKRAGLAAREHFKSQFCGSVVGPQLVGFLYGIGLKSI